MIRSAQSKNQSSNQPMQPPNMPVQTAFLPAPAGYPPHFYHPAYGHMPGFPTFASPGAFRRIANPPHTPGSESVEDIDDDITLFPRVTDWLHGLDNGPHGADRHNFSQYTANFEDNMYFRVNDLEHLSKEDLITMCAMPPGTANLICKYSRKDCDKIRKEALNKIREARLQPKRYL